VKDLRAKIESRGKKTKESQNLRRFREIRDLWRKPNMLIGLEIGAIEKFLQ